MTEKCDECSWKRMDRTPPEMGGLSYYYYQCDKCHDVSYPMEQLQILYDYADTHQFMFLADWVLALFYALPDSPIVGSTSLQKQVFLTMMEFVEEEKIPSENPGFRAFYFGPYSDRVDRLINVLLDEDIVTTYGGRANSDNEHMELTEHGKDVAKQSFEKLTESQREKLVLKRRRYQQIGTKGLIKYVYTHYPAYLGDSLIKDRVLRTGKNRKMHI